MTSNQRRPKTNEECRDDTTTLKRRSRDNVVARRFSMLRRGDVEMTSLLTPLTSMKYNGQGNMNEYIMEMFHV
ncbi:hypothetical protein Goklo_000317, partial [Gossypium klotzschianum]|nr:hypothetical protein [Gossypium klotzschianum]